ncbi:MAG: type II toxin-antitoxin system Phd/YefM family antitoxin [candidate division WOR-3 bacterium]|nr:type II toxin-antitoxin system Phd/YefM family antitoxin [candidate division WOR-3 bacterium]
MRKFKAQYIIGEKGQKRAIILPLKEYEELLEDLHDLAVVAERRNEPSIPFDKIKDRLRKNGLI